MVILTVVSQHLLLGQSTYGNNTVVLFLMFVTCASVKVQVLSDFPVILAKKVFPTKSTTIEDVIVVQEEILSL